MNKILYGNCLNLLNSVEDKSIDLIFCDLPYGTTKCSWDIPIPLNEHIIINNKVYYKNQYFLYCFLNKIKLDDCVKNWKQYKKLGLWDNYKRIIKDNGCILLFAQTPFDKELGESNKKMLRYEWVWEKPSATGFYNAKKMPMKAHENILVFYSKLPTYNPQKTYGHKPINSYNRRAEIQNKTQIYGKIKGDYSGGGETDRYPRSVILFSSDKQKTKLDKTIYPTQKPLKLIEYFIKTYTNENDLILDNCAGSGTTGIGCENLNRNYILMDNNIEAINLMKKRIKGEYFCNVNL